MFNSQFFADTNVYADLFQRLAVMSAEHPEYVDLLLVFLLIYAVMLLPYQFRILFLKFENARLTRRQVSLKRRISALECSDAIAMPEMIEKTVPDDCRDDCPHYRGEYRHYRDLWVDRHGGLPQLLRAMLMAMWAAGVALVCSSDPGNLSFVVTCIGTGLVYAVLDGERQR